MVICDSHILVWDALERDRLSARVQETLTLAEDTATLACADISLWEIAMLIARHRIPVDEPPQRFLCRLIERRGIQVLPITPEIAELAQSALFTHGDPADRLIAATAWHHRATLVTHDAKLQAIPGLKTFF